MAVNPECPQNLDEHFLAWLRDVTERNWATRSTPTLATFQEEGCGGAEYQHGTRWAGGLDEATIVAIEERIALRFPSDYRLFLGRLHTTDRPMICAHIGDDGQMFLAHEWGITNWLAENEPMRSAVDGLVDGFAFDVEEAGLWRSDWGSRPLDAASRRACVEKAILAGPKLIPVHGQVYLLGEPCQAGNPVLSVYQSDVIVFANNLQEYLAFALGGAPRRHHTRCLDEVRQIPFWGEFIR